MLSYSLAPVDGFIIKSAPALLIWVVWLWFRLHGTDWSDKARELCFVAAKLIHTESADPLSLSLRHVFLFKSCSCAFLFFFPLSLSGCLLGLCSYWSSLCVCFFFYTFWVNLHLFLYLNADVIVLRAQWRADSVCGACTLGAFQIFWCLSFCLFKQSSRESLSLCASDFMRA